MIDTILSAGKNIDKSDVVIVSAGYEKTASSRKGTAKGPKAVMKMLDSKLELFDRNFKKEASKFIKIAAKDLGDISKLTPEGALKKITAECDKIVSKGKFVLLLGGEHSVSLGLFQSLAKVHNPKDVTILQIDAHCDLRDTDADYNPKPTKYAHSCVLHRATDLQYPLVQVGIRTYSIHEYKYFSDPKNNITVFEWGNPDSAHDVWQAPSIDEILASIKTKYVYLTIDVDGFDPAYMPGTGTPVQGGIEWWYGVELINRLINEKVLIGADIVEVSPMKDSVLTEYGAAQLAYNIITNKFRDKLK
jgi:agmatinase